LKPAAFSFTRARSIEHVLDLLGQHGDEAKIIAGGQSLMPTLNLRLSAPRVLIDISPLDALRGIHCDGDRLIVGALTRHVELQESNAIRTHVPLVASAITHVAHAAIRNRGTLGGNLSLADPASELPACCVALDAQFTIAGRKGERVTAAADFFRDLYETDLAADEVLVSVTFPLASPHNVHGFREFVRRRGDFACAGLALNGEFIEGRFSSLSAVFFALGNTPLPAPGACEPLLDNPLTGEAIDRAVAALDGELEVIGDVHTPEAMKRHLPRHYFREILTGIHDSR